MADGLFGGGQGGNQTVVASVTSAGDLVGRMESEPRELLAANLPEDLRGNPDEAMQVLVINREVVALSRGYRQGKPIEPGILYILNRRSEKWNRLDLHTTLTWVRGFGVWLVGMGAEDNRDHSRVSPGLDQRRRATAKACAGSGRCDNIATEELFQNSGTYFPGALFIHNVDTGAQYSINTGQGDSEVLLVENGTVYYRVNDTILSAPIGEKGLGAAVRLVTSPAVTQVHWMFSSGR